VGASLDQHNDGREATQPMGRYESHPTCARLMVEGGRKMRKSQEMMNPDV